VAIAAQYLVPRQIRQNGLLPEEVGVDTAVLRQIIRDYTREAGVQRAGAADWPGVPQGGNGRGDPARWQPGHQPRHVQPEHLPEFLGPARYFADAAQRTSLAGVATGLAWTSTGGHILFIEAAQMPGQKGLTITGQLGEVMQESAQAALTYVRSRADQLGVAANFFDQHDIHIHIPAGAIPKDGPSAGITIATALASLLTKRPVCHDTGMTGRNYFTGPGHADWGRQGKGAGGPPRRAAHRHFALPKRARPGRHS
jgi:ATP-dependent Lon protease